MPEKATLNLDITSLPGPETVHRTVLANGITVLVRENFSSPSVVVSGYLHVGALDEEPAQAGLAGITATALMRGTQQRSFNEIHESIESIGARLVVSGATHSTPFQGKALAEDLPVLLELLGEVLQVPVFPDEEVARLKAEMMTGLAIREQDTGARAHMAFYEQAYPDHPFSIDDDGYVYTIEPLQRADLVAFHRKFYGPHGMVIVISGAAATAQAVAVVEDALGGWQAAERSIRPSLPALTLPVQSIRKDIALAGKIQSDLVMGLPGPSRYDPLFLPAAVGNSILGRFGLFGRIGDSVREAEGLAYYAYSTVEGGAGPGAWKVIAGVNPGNLDKAIGLIQAEISTYLADGVTDEELLDVKSNFIGRLPLQLESNEGVAGALTHMERYQLGLDYYQRYPQLIQNVSKEEILQISRQYLDAGNLVVVTAGPALKA